MPDQTLAYRHIWTVCQISNRHLSPWRLFTYSLASLPCLLTASNNSFLCHYRSSQNFLLTKETFLRKQQRTGSLNLRPETNWLMLFKAGFTFINVWAVDLLNLYLNKQKALKWVVSFQQHDVFINVHSQQGEEISCYNSLITWERIMIRRQLGGFDKRQRRTIFLKNIWFVTCSTFSSNGILRFLVIRNLYIFAWRAFYT